MSRENLLVTALPCGCEWYGDPAKIPAPTPLSREQIASLFHPRPKPADLDQMAGSVMFACGCVGRE